MATIVWIGIQFVIIHYSEPVTAIPSEMDWLPSIPCGRLQEIWMILLHLINGSNAMEIRVMRERERILRRGVLSQAAPVV